jgi:hypothetical protein
MNAIKTKPADEWTGKASDVPARPLPSVPRFLEETDAFAEYGDENTPRLHRESISRTSKRPRCDPSTSSFSCFCRTESKSATNGLRSIRLEQTASRDHSKST